jgi:hypothetical protein
MLLLRERAIYKLYSDLPHRAYCPHCQMEVMPEPMWEEKECDMHVLGATCPICQKKIIKF